MDMPHVACKLEEGRGGGWNAVIGPGGEVEMGDMVDLTLLKSREGRKGKDVIQVLYDALSMHRRRKKLMKMVLMSDKRQLKLDTILCFWFFALHHFILAEHIEK